jgi:hypothetical protein
MSRRRLVAGGVAIVAIALVAHLVVGRAGRSAPARPPVVAAPEVTHDSRKAGVAVALTYVRSSGELVSRGPIGRRDLLARLVVPSLLDAQSSTVDRDVTAIRSHLVSGTGQPVPISSLRWVETPLTASVTGSGSVLELRIWSVAVLGAPGLDDVQAAWRTFSLTVRWVDDRWLVTEVSVEPGPAPLETPLDVPPSSFGEFERVASWPRAGA